MNKTLALAFFLFTSSRRGPNGEMIFHKTARDGSGCTCKGYLWRGECAHALAARTAAEQAREAVSRKTERRSYRELMDNALVDAF